jgi:hypothetical protein
VLQPGFITWVLVMLSDNFVPSFPLYTEDLGVHAILLEETFRKLRVSFAFLSPGMLVVSGLLTILSPCDSHTMKENIKQMHARDKRQGQSWFVLNR